MKWSFIIQQKFKASLLLGGIMVTIILGTVLSRNNIEGIDKSFSSIYQDRLIPATTIIYLTENLYNKRLSLEKYLFSEDHIENATIDLQLNRYNKNLDSLTTAFEKTYLIEEEARILANFRDMAEAYILLEKQIIDEHRFGDSAKAKEMFEGVGVLTFQNSLAHLNELAKIQSQVGNTLMQKSRIDFAGFEILSFLQIALAVILGLIILVLIKNSRIINKPDILKTKGQNFHLN
ncbi:MCP four helix bundle domain-containing protein [Dyadobacter subterraneus]|uniref:MCP four helix bundle domain-containing protein n=1 Tax=Dyadobacter subterraneus TaxID=2773304 RepID=A0ABR9WG22_9BACT|nr:MCP four helix bundle domain-containing protein [Dyadobacter subterraneus]MBE9464343.1 MCP four helix bundle domain-containing protein [Dyadobacter subterraneus]